MPTKSPAQTDAPKAMRRPVALFRNGRNQAIRIPKEFEMDASQATMHREGDRLIITPIKPRSLLDVVATWKPLPDLTHFEPEDAPAQVRDTF
jgi:antitoxin VapB